METDKKQGWVRFYRKSIDSSIWEDPIKWYVWSWCLLKANHQKNTFPFNGSDITVEPGSFISGINKALTEMPSLTTQKLRTVFKYLKLTGRITIKSNNKFSLFKVNKWIEHQVDNRLTNKPLTNEQQATNKPLTTNKNDKNDNNDNNITSPKGEVKIKFDFLNENSYIEENSIPSSIDEKETPLNNAATPLEISAPKICTKSSAKDIDEIIDDFQFCNKTMYAEFFKRNVERQAVDKLIIAYGFDFVKYIVINLSKINLVIYGGASYSPTELLRNWSKLVTGINKQKKVINDKNSGRGCIGNLEDVINTIKK